MLGRMTAADTGRIFVGIGGWNYPPWRGAFYPAKLPQVQELGYASRAMTSIEINSTFYGSQKPASFQRWHDATPEGFVFAVKGPRYATNRHDLAQAGESIERFLDGGLLRLGAKLGPINWQLAPTKQFAVDEIEAFMVLLPQQRDGHRLRHALEVRHASFAVPEFVALARRHGIAIVIAGDARYPQIADPTADFAYLRIMGTSATERDGYPAAALTRWAKRAQALASGGAKPAGLSEVEAPTVAQATGPRDVYLYVISGAKERNPAAARALLQRLATQAS
jgi:uncharacterized protein YecE (DUF72 family)